MVSMQLKAKQPENYNDKGDFQVIDNGITSVDNYFALTHTEPPDIYHYMNTIFSGEAAAWFRYVYRNVEPNKVTWRHLLTRQPFLSKIPLLQAHPLPITIVPT
jgi:hypothetical protein